MTKPGPPSYLIHGGFETRNFCRLCGDPIVGSEIDPCEVSVEAAWSQARKDGREIHIFYCHATCLSPHFRFSFSEETEDPKGKEEPAHTEN